MQKKQKHQDFVNELKIRMSQFKDKTTHNKWMYQTTKEMHLFQIIHLH